MRNKYIVFSILYIGVLVFLSFPVFAQEATKSASPSSSLIEKLNQLKAEIASKASQLKKEVNKKLENKAIAGVIDSITDDQINLATKNGNKTIVLNEYTIFEINERDVDLEDFKEEEYIVALGDFDDKENLVAKKVIKLDEEDYSPKEIVWGQIQSLSPLSLILRNKDHKDLNILINRNTSYYLGPDEITYSQINSKTFAALTGQLNEDQSIRAGFIYIIPSGGILKSNKPKVPSPVATSSFSSLPK
ncbi:hypothetical protein HYS91_03290 [Candidatus Daviesbacteria bacterium]|nr:hypothetical protein [Candidatus Daviesbacteria bacterium]